MSAERCKGTAWNPSGQVRGGGREVGCSKPATRDGWCGTHHPDAVAKREARVEAERKVQAERDRARWAREARNRTLLATIDRMTADEIATLPELLRAILHPAPAYPTTE